MESATLLYSNSNVTHWPAEENAVTLDPRPLAIKVIHIFLSSFGIPANIMAAFVMLSSPQMRSKPVNVMMINQACLDTLSCIISLAIEFTNDVTIVETSSRFFQDVFCNIWISTYAFWAVMFSSAYNLVFLSLERYFAITNPMKYDREKVMKRLPIIICMAWASGFIGDLPTMFVAQYTQGLCVYTAHIRYPVLHKIFSAYFIVVYIGIPTVIVLFAYIRMGLTLRQSEFASKDKSKAQVNLLQTCFMVTLMFSVSGLNLCISLVLFMVGFYDNLGGHYYTISILVMMLNQCLNPFVYCVRYKEFMQQLKHLLGIKGKRSGKEALDTTASTVAT